MNSLLFATIRPAMAVIVGACTTLAFAPYNLAFIAILSPLLLLLLLSGQSTKRAKWIGYSWGLGQFATGISWVHISIDTFGGMPKIASVFLMSLLIAYLAIYPALWAYSLNRFFKKNSPSRFLLAAPALWVISEWLRGVVFTGFPWLSLGYSQINSPLANVAPIGGVETISLIIILVSGAMAYALSAKKWSYLLLAALIIGLGQGLSYVHWVQVNPAKNTKITLVQGNISQKLKWVPKYRWPTIERYTNLTEQHWDSDIIIWPEAAIPAFETEIPDYLSALDKLAKEHGTAIITGIVNQNTDQKYYNSVLTLGDNEQGAYRFDLTQRYNKHHLLVFGEYVPFEHYLRELAPFFNLPMSSFTEGAYLQPNIIAHGMHLVAALCYEIIFAEQLRDNLTSQTDFILTLSNDAWFGDSIGPLQHMQIAQMRALEFGKPLIRATNNGITAVTDHLGQIIKSLPQFEIGTLTVTLSPTTGTTPYRQFGSVPLYVYVLMSLLAALYWQKKNNQGK